MPEKVTTKDVTPKADTAKPVKTKLARRKISKKTIAILAWILVLIIVGISSFVLARNNALAANRVAEKSLSALKANDDKTVYELGSNDFKKASDQKKVKTVVNQWSKVISQATEGEPQLLNKQAATKDGKALTALMYKYEVKEGKSKINQKELLVQITVEKTDSGYKLHTFTIDPQKPAKK